MMLTKSAKKSHAYAGNSIRCKHAIKVYIDVKKITLFHLLMRDEIFSQNCIIIAIFIFSGCVEGQFWDEQGEEFGSGGPAGECVSCSVERYQDMAYHRQTQCKNCSGTETILKYQLSCEKK